MLRTKCSSILENGYFYLSLSGKSLFLDFTVRTWKYCERQNHEKLFLFPKTRCPRFSLLGFSSNLSCLTAVLVLMGIFCSQSFDPGSCSSLYAPVYSSNLGDSGLLHDLNSLGSIHFPFPCRGESDDFQIPYAPDQKTEVRMPACDHLIWTLWTQSW